MDSKRVTITLGCAALLLAGPAIAGTIKGKITIPHARTLADLVVYVDKASGSFPPPKQHVVMNQKNLAFVPHVLPVVLGTTVDFLNSDQVLHNVFTPDKCAKKFNLGTWPKGEVRSVTFDQPGCSPVLLCNVHPEMEGFIVVLQNPYFGVTDKAGLYSIPNVPEGKYTLKVWNKKTLGPTHDVSVPKEGDVVSDITLP
jgi:plastocyanin